MFEFRYNFNFVPVSTEFIENYMTRAHGDYVKVYLYILCMAIKGGSDEPRRIAKALNMLEGDVLNAIEYWQEQGLLNSAGTTITVGAVSSAGAQPQTELFKTVPVINETDIPAVAPANEEHSEEKKSINQISDIILHDQKLSDLCTMAQEMLGKTLNNPDIETLYWIYDHLGLSTEVIMMLLEYCVSKNNSNMNYIEKVAISWHEKGITTMEEADRFINEEQEDKSYFSELKKLLGITSRPLSKTEEAYLSEWKDNYSMSSEMVALAYEYCIMRIGRLSFQYMDSIIKNWNKKNIHTIEAAERDQEEFRSKNSAKNPKMNERDTGVYGAADTDYDAAERRMNEKYN